MSHSEHGHGTEGASPESVASGYELSDWRWKPVLVLTLSTFAIMALAYVVILVMVFATGGSVGDASHTLAPTDSAQSQVPPEPRLEQNPNVDGDRLVTEATTRLSSYGWEDQRAGVAHIPIERAMELLLVQGVDPFTGRETGPIGAAPAEPAAPVEPVAPIIFDATLAAQGQQLFANLGCVGCHRDDGVGLGPGLNGLYNRPRPLEGGESVVADEAYLIESILQPGARMAQGYQPIMPSYQGQLSDEQVRQLVEYIKSLGE
ncbi:MAG: c-type cytochrome [Oscillochloridaceae bacterium umkhey_bin13]